MRDAVTDGEDPGPIGEALREFRLRAGLTQRQLAGKAGVSVGVIRDVEQGLTARPRPVTLARLGAALGLSASQSAALRPAPALAIGQAAARPGAGATSRGTHARRDSRLRIRVLGALSARRDGTPVPLGPARQQAVFGLLAADPGSVWYQESFAEALWAGDPPPTAITMIQTYISRLRGLLDPERTGLVSRAGTGYRLRQDAAELDVVRFRRLSWQAAKALGGGDTAAACRLYEQALALWRGEPLAGLGTLRSHAVVTGLANERTAVIVAYARAAAAEGWHDRALPHLRALAARDPLNERACACLMIALAGCGQQAAALTAYEQLRRRLDDQLGIRPGPELAAAHARVLRNQILISA